MMNDSIYGKFIEHPEYPIDDIRRFTIEIKPHAFANTGAPLDAYGFQSKCMVCGFKRGDDVHVIYELIEDDKNTFYHGEDIENGLD